jgi:TolB-like protein/DNA-binding SARP family transcriptional activator
MSAPRFHLSLLGRFELRGPEGLLELGGSKLAALLAYLSSTFPERHGREKLMTLLWGSRIDNQARQNLRQTLHRLRHILGDDALVIDGSSVSINSSVVASDLSRFSFLLGVGTRDALKEAVDLYKGGLLDEISIAEEAWTEWLGVESQRLEDLALNAIVKLGELELLAANPEGALRAAHRAYAIDHLREDAHRLAIRALAASGRRADALKHYEDYAVVLRRELDAEPDPSTRQLAADLRKPRRAHSGWETSSGPRYELQSSSDPGREELPLPDRPSLAILPFDNMSGDPEQEYFADGMVDDLLVGLSRVRWLFVIARQSSFCYKGRVVDVRQIGRQLGVRYVVEGSVRKVGNRVRIAAQLIETETGGNLWADRYESNLGEIFALQDEITGRIVAAVELNVQTAEIRRARAKPTDSLTAYDLYLRALPAYFGYTLADYQRAQALLGRSIDVDPEYAEAIGTLTDSVAVSTLMGWQESRARGLAKSQQLARRALAVGPDNSTCVASAAFTYAVLLHGFQEGLDLADRALLLHPNSLLVRNRIASVYAACGECDKAIAQCDAARRMNPLDTRKAATATYTVLATALYYARRFEECILAGRRALTLAATASIARKYVAMSFAQLGRVDEARAEIVVFVKDQPDASLALFRQQSFRHQWMHDLHMEGLRRAGLRE